MKTGYIHLNHYSRVLKPKHNLLQFVFSFTKQSNASTSFSR